MKGFQFFKNFIFAMLVAMVGGSGIAMATGMSPTMCIGALGAASLIPSGAQGAAMTGVYKEVWTKDVLKGFNEALKATFLGGIPDYSQYVKGLGDANEAIHMTYFGVSPDVLINNTTYPIPRQELNGENISLTLDKYQTKVTPITDDELYALNYDKIKLARESHIDAINTAKYKKAIHAIAPGDATNADMPVLVTTGEDDGTGRKKLLLKDIIAFKRKLDALQIPNEGRRLVLCSDHVNDLLDQSQTFEKQYYNYTTGKIANMYGFEVYTYSDCPYFNATTKTKLSFGAVAGDGDYQASIFFLPKRISKATGLLKFYYKKSENSPEDQTSLINYRHNFLIMPKREDGRGAIISGKAA